MKLFGAFGLVIFATQIHDYYSEYARQVGTVSWGFILTCVAISFIGIGSFLMLIAHKIRRLVQQNHFAHRQLNNSFHSSVRLPDYAAQDPTPVPTHHVFIATTDGLLDVGPPAYETVVNGASASQDEAAPPPYSLFAKPDEDPAH